MRRQSIFKGTAIQLLRLCARLFLDDSSQHSADHARVRTVLAYDWCAHGRPSAKGFARWRDVHRHRARDPVVALASKARQGGFVADSHRSIGYL